MNCTLFWSALFIQRADKFFWGNVKKLNKSFIFFSTADKFFFLLGTKNERLQYALARFIKISFKTRQLELEDAITSYFVAVCPGGFVF